jgi:hypothetical protein
MRVMRTRRSFVQWYPLQMATLLILIILVSMS